MTTIEDLDRRVSALEVSQYDTTQTLRWVVSKLGRITAVQDGHTLQLERIEARLDRIEHDVTGLRRDMPGIVADAMREVLSLYPQWPDKTPGE